MSTDAARVLAADLRARDDAALTALIRARPDVVAGLVPRTFSELAERLLLPGPVLAAVSRTTTPQLQVLQALVAVKGVVGADGLAAFFGKADRDEVEAVLAHLAACALALRTGDGWVPVPALESLLADPYGLGPSVADAVAEVNVDGLRRLCRKLGVVPERGNRASLLSAIEQRLADAEWVRSRLATASPAVLDMLLSESDDDAYTPVSHVAVAWLDEQGLAIVETWRRAVVVPAPVVLAARGPGWHPPFDPLPPPLFSSAVDPRPLRDEAAVGLTRTVAHLLAVLDHVVRVRVPTLRSGGVGARELAKLARATAGDETETRLVVEISLALDALVVTPDGLAPGPALAELRGAPPGVRAARVITSWHDLAWLPTEERDQDGKALAVGRRDAGCVACRTGRWAYLDALASSDGAPTAESAAQRAAWLAPFGHGAPREGRAFGAVRDEATRLGVVALGALTPLGRLLLDRDHDALAAAAAKLLPEITQVATFGSDLTAYVAGTPSAELAALLDSAADRESRGGAIVWRFGPASVRRAFDDGADADGLIGELTAAARQDLPQSLRVLVADVARRHGHIVVSPAVSVLRIDDPALLAEIVGDRRLRGLGLRQISHTVLAADAEAADVLARLRALGWLPVAGGTDPPPTADAPTRAPRARARPAGPDLPLLIAALREADDAPAPTSATAVRLSDAAPQLTAAEVALLAYAVDEGVPVAITYRSGSGAVTHRTVEALSLDLGFLTGWCRLRQGERIFSLRGILEVEPS